MGSPLNPRSARPALLGLPFDHNSSFLRGAAEAPPAIRRALRSPAFNSWTERGLDLSAPGRLFDAGDASKHPESEWFPRIQNAVAALVCEGRTPLLLGGDHAVTYPAVRGLQKGPRGERRFEPLTIVHIDAHPDVYDEFEGNRYSHASPFARIMEERLATRLIQIGIRTATAHQRDQMRRFGIECVEARSMPGDEAPRLSLSGPVYISLDVDGLDPSIAPGVSHPEPGGLSMRQTLRIIHGIDAPIIAADIVEYNPARDIHDLTATVCAKLVKEIAAQMILNGSAA